MNDGGTVSLNNLPLLNIPICNQVRTREVWEYEKGDDILMVWLVFLKGWGALAKPEVTTS